ncbi:MAG: hypothetical protein CVV41_21030 [Candidatus Riflebacteria bacterium HGW-Riflebacteria-1]|nr:MAG: hypothetical protein CVV41_21030 [Candidatus Riflebacteria bacterium HGW-Riflebacteria-1]
MYLSKHKSRLVSNLQNLLPLRLLRRFAPRNDRIIQGFVIASRAKQSHVFRTLQVTLVTAFLLFALPLAGAAAELPAIYKVAFDVGAQFYDYQNYQNIPYFHGGLDLCAPAGTEVFTPVAGRVSVSDYKIVASANPHRFSYQRTPFRRGMTSNTRYLEVSIVDANGYSWMFRHIDPGSVPAEVFAAAESGKSVTAGSKIGKVARWHQPVFPEKRNYDHIHLEIIGPDGAYCNPAAFTGTVKDYYPPVIHTVYAARHGTDDAVALDANNRTLSGKINLVIGANDRMNRAAYQHAIYRAVWSLDRLGDNGSATSQIPEQEVFKFDRLPFTGERVQLSTVIYRDSLRVDTGRIRANGADGPRFFLIDLTSGTSSKGYAPTNHLDTTLLANGRYRLNISVSDLTANARQKSVEFQIKN